MATTDRIAILERHWIVRLGEILGKLTVFVALFLWIGEAGDRRIQQEHRAWSVLIAATGLAGNYGRIRALQELNREGVRLDGVNLSNGLLPDLKLDNANMSEVNFTHADISRASFRQSDLKRADFSNSDVKGVDFSNAELQCALFCSADMRPDRDGPVILTGSDVGYADFSNVKGLTCDQLAAAKNWKTSIVAPGTECPGYSASERTKNIRQRFDQCSSYRPEGCAKTG